MREIEARDDLPGRTHPLPREENQGNRHEIIPASSKRLCVE